MLRQTGKYLHLQFLRYILKNLTFYGTELFELRDIDCLGLFSIQAGIIWVLERKMSTSQPIVIFSICIMKFSMNQFANIRIQTFLRGLLALVFLDISVSVIWRCFILTICDITMC